MKTGMKFIQEHFGTVSIIELEQIDLFGIPRKSFIMRSACSHAKFPKCKTYDEARKFCQQAGLDYEFTYSDKERAQNEKN